MGGKPHPERVDPHLLRKVIKTGKPRQTLYSEYIVLHYRATGRLAPGCDAKDFYAALDQMISQMNLENSGE